MATFVDGPGPGLRPGHLGQPRPRLRLARPRPGPARRARGRGRSPAACVVEVERRRAPTTCRATSRTWWCARCARPSTRWAPQPPGPAAACRNVIPHARGLGSSSAAIVGRRRAWPAALVAGGTLLVDDDALFDLAARLEGHPDNVAPALLRRLRRSPAATTTAFYAVALGGRPAGRRRGLRARRRRSRPRSRAGCCPSAVPHADAAADAGRAALLVAALGRAARAAAGAPPATTCTRTTAAPAMPESLAAGRRAARRRRARRRLGRRPDGARLHRRAGRRRPAPAGPLPGRAGSRTTSRWTATAPACTDPPPPVYVRIRARKKKCGWSPRPALRLPRLHRAIGHGHAHHLVHSPTAAPPVSTTSAPVRHHHRSSTHPLQVRSTPSTGPEFLPPPTRHHHRPSPDASDRALGAPGRPSRGVVHIAVPRCYARSASDVGGPRSPDPGPEVAQRQQVTPSLGAPSPRFRGHLCRTPSCSLALWGSQAGEEAMTSSRRPAGRAALIRGKDLT